MELKARLQAAADFVRPGDSVADIGTDHAYLPVYLVENKISAQAVACDIKEGPCNAARRTLAAAGKEKEIAVRMGDGLAPLAPGEVQTAVIAGMGGAAMMAILAECPETARSLERLILQPMNGAAKLRRYLIENGWRIIGENLILEDGRLYEIICAEAGQCKLPEPILLDIGPRLWEKRHPLLGLHIKNLLDQANHTLRAMQASDKAKRSEKYQAVREWAAALKERLQCL